MASRAKSLLELSNTLVHLIKNPKKIKESLFFVITKYQKHLYLVPSDIKDKEARFKDVLRNKISQLIKNESDKIEKLKTQIKKNDETPEKIKIQLSTSYKKLNFLKIVKSRFQKIILIDPLDEGESKAEVEQHLSNSKSINYFEFDFSDHDEAWIKFNHLLLQVTHKANSLIKDKRQLTGEIQLCEKSVSNAKDSVAYYRQQLEGLVRKDTGTDIQIQLTKNDIARNINSLNTLRNESLQVRGRIRELTLEKNDLDTDELIEYRKLRYPDLDVTDTLADQPGLLSQVTVAQKLFGLLFCTNHTFEYNDIPFDNLEESKCRGSFENPFEEK